MAGHQVAAVTARLQQIVPPDELAELLREGHQTSPTKVLELVVQFAEREIKPRLNTGENAAEPRLRLTKREVEVLALMAYKSDKEIADDLEISPRTVTTHVSHILSKLHAMSRTEAVTRAMRKGIISLHQQDLAS